MTALKERLTSSGPKRILALDGGGIRGIVTLGFLEKIERILADRHPHVKDFRLSHYFDLIGGTSTGSIIAALLAIGMKVSDIKEMYLHLGGKIFGKKKGIFSFIAKAEKYDSNPLKKELEAMFGDMPLGDQERIKTGLCIVAKRADTFSTWPIINHPNGTYYEMNASIPLKDAVRASTAAPTYFIPEVINVGNEELGTFIDGGVSLANNPALQLFMVATLKGFPFHWDTGSDELFLVSIGTGISTKRTKQFKHKHLGDWAARIPELFMEDANYFNQLILQYLSQSPTARQINSEVGALDNDLLHGQSALSYLRYNVKLDKDELDELGFDLSSKEVEDLRAMDKAKNRFELAKIGEVAGEKFVIQDHFPEVFNIK